MDYRQLGRSGLRVSALTLGTMTFGGGGRFGLVGSTDVAGAKRQVDMCIDAGINMIDTADVYSAGASEEIVGEAIKGRRHDLLIATKARMTMGDVNVLALVGSLRAASVNRQLAELPAETAPDGITVTVFDREFGTYTYGFARRATALSIPGRSAA